MGTVNVREQPVGTVVHLREQPVGTVVHLREEILEILL